MTLPSSLTRKILAAGLGLAWLLLGTGCVSAWRAKASLYDAFYRNQTGDNVAALAKIQEAVKRCEWPGVPGYVVIETYDDAGLYYYLNERAHESFVHQAVAVLLAEAIPMPANMRAIYLERLLRARAASDIDLVTADAIRADRRVLLSVPEVRDNPRVRKYYGRPSGP